MATIKFMSWNIENWGGGKNGGKAGNPNNNNFIIYVTYMLYLVSPDFVSFLELQYGNAGGQLTKIVNLWTAMYNKFHPNNTINNPWKVEYVNCMKNNESYAIIYRTDKGFDPLYSDGSTAHSPNNTRLMGLVSQTATGQDIDWPGGNEGKVDDDGNPIGGRPAFYAIFKTNDANNAADNVVFSFLAYHNASGNYAIDGLTSIAESGQITTSVVTNPQIAIANSLISGDFNVSIDSNMNSYNPLFNLPSYACTLDKTSLKKVAPDLDEQDDPEAYRANAYDNIFQKVAQANSAQGVVVDLIKLSALIKSNGNNNQGALYKMTQKFKPQYFMYTRYRDCDIPITDYLNSWKFVAGAISDHLPVYVSTVIQN